MSRDYITNKQYRAYKRKRTKSKWLFIFFIASLIYVATLFKNKNNFGLLLFICISFLTCIGIFSVFRCIKKQIYLHSPIHRVDRMSGEQFEEYLKYNFEQFGYKVSLTPKTGDYGADLICKKNGQILIIQAKRYKDKVRNSAIQEIVAAKAYYKADKCMVVTNSYFSEPAKELAKANDVELWDRDSLFKHIGEPVE